MKNSVGTCVMFYLLIMQSGDVEINPGPAKYPCGICEKNVGWNAKAIQCDCCDVWFHVKCANIGPESFKVLNKTEVTWICTHCGIPNLSSYHCIDLDELKSENTYQPLSGDTSSALRELDQSIGNFGISTPKYFQPPNSNVKDSTTMLQMCHPSRM